MRTHLRSNAVAYLALFVALGGSSYAAVNITSNQIKDRSLQGRDIKRESLTGAEIRESSLGEVGQARRAGQADQAASAARAARAGQADDAAKIGGLPPAAFLPAGAKAVDADRIDGIESSQLLRTTVVAGVVADTTVASSTVYTDPLGFSLRTDGDTSAEPDLDLVNVRASGGGSLRVMRSASSVLLPAGIGALATVITADKPTLVIDEADPTQMAQITCAKDFTGGSGRVVCMVIRSRN
ncbi:MAG: hypothetical protein U0R70_17345 [Solirubrobacteraceae bacterium]